MRYRFFISTLGITLLFMSCASTKQLQFQKEVSSSIALGVIVKREGALKNNVEIKGIPALSDKLRVAITEKAFSQHTWAQYKKADVYSKSTVKKGDSLIPTTTYFEVELVDDIGYIAAINKDQNILTYIRNGKKGGAITKVAMVPKKPMTINAGTHFFLEDIGNKTYAIGVYEKGNRIAQLMFSEMNVFKYQPSYFCFGESDTHEAIVMDLVEEGKSCKRPLRKKAKKVAKEKSIFDY